MDYGTISLNIESLLKEKGISKNRICKDLDIPRTNFNRYCKDDFARIDSKFLCKLCWYLEIEISNLMTYHRPKESE